MSNQIVISSGAKVRSLEGVLTGSAGIVSSVPLGGANGVATLDSSGKVPLSQLPASVVTYLGTWNAATNTPTLANGTGDVGDLYICNVAGTVNFGAGPITFAVGDWVIYNGSQWQKSAGQNGTVTSVAVTSTGNDAISITGSPITTAGTINIGFTGDNTQYVNGAGDLTTFPSLTGFVPYTGATQTLDMGAFDVNARGFKVNGTAGSGHVDFKHQSGTPTGSASSTTMFADTNGNMAWKNDHNYITTLASNANTADRTYTFPDANGTIALTSNLTSYIPYSGATTNVNLGSYGLSGNGDFVMGSVKSAGIFAESGAGAAGYLYLKGDSSFGLLSGYNSIFANGFKYGFEAYGGSSLNSKRAYLDFGSLTNNTTRTYTFPNASGTIALTSDISYPVTSVFGRTGAVTAQSGDYTTTLVTEGTNLYYTDARARGAISLTTTGTSGAATYNSTTGVLNVPNYGSALSGYVPYTGATSQVDLGSNNLYGKSLNVWGDGTNGGGLNLKQYTSQSFLPGYGYTAVFTDSSYGFGIWFLNSASTGRQINFNASLLANNTGQTYYLPAATGTIALTSDLTGGTVTSVGLSSATSGVTIGSSPVTTSGTITLAIATASGSQQGLLSSTDWTTFNNKQNALTNPVTGTGTTNYLPKFTGTSTIGNSAFYEASGNLLIGSTTAGWAGTTGIELNGAETVLAFRKSGANAGYLYHNGTNLYLSNELSGGSAGSLIFNNNLGERMRILPSGNVLIGTSTDSTSGFNKVLTIANDYLPSLELRKIGTIGGARTYNLGVGNTGSFTIYDANAVLDRLVITSSGNVGIGTSSPVGKLHIVGGSGNGNTLRLDSYDNAGDNWIGFYQNNGTRIGYMGYGYSASNIMEIFQEANEPLIISTNATERMRITSAGDVSMNKDLYVGGQGYKPGGGSWANSSDIRLKENIKTIENALDKIIQLRGVTFDWKQGYTENGKKESGGFIADEVMEVFPDWVSETNATETQKEIVNDDKIKSLSLPFSFDALLVEAIKELSAKVTALENKI